MPSDKAAYLASHYLTTDSKPSSKKRKRKAATSNSGLLITDDDDTGWGTSSRKDADDDDDAPIAVVAGSTSDFRRAKKSAWKTIGESSSSSSITAAAKDDAAAEADAIIASAAAESAAARAREQAEDLPLAAQDDTAAPLPLMSNGAQAGLQSAASLTAQLRARQQLEREELAQLQASKQQAQEEEQVILRDATGRRVDASLRRAEARRAAAEAERAAQAKERLLKGDVQVAAARARREQLEEAALMPLARGKDDAEMNEAMKRAERWNDPMAEFLVDDDKGDRGGAWARGGKGAGGKGMRRPVYKGPAPPNRYGIRPGYRWDGVDRGNGFEAERFKAINRRERNRGLEYAWQMDE
ncbi:Pre-mRNA-splicing factor cwc26 [Madurella fahalii]|uniref:Pre-mRNA-splicing factor cwc26 n=1 Tax=Madurella fahalii TaxID=1157608 RepID=A0ABQ0GM69_9PEZI